MEESQGSTEPLIYVEDHIWTDGINEAIYEVFSHIYKGTTSSNTRFVSNFKTFHF